MFSSPFTASDAPGPSGFSRAYGDRHRTPPGRWSAEAYDAVGLLTAALDTLPAADATAATPAQRLFTTTHRGLAKPLAFAPGLTHALQLSDTSLFLYEAPGPCLPLPGAVRECTGTVRLTGHPAHPGTGAASCAPRQA
ncbi:hypothetical protein QMZ92_09750 [Streptomyces sp. HNM0645]|uniref:hypothetical protein n=1 Tax=Streptomyces sp. HNM0645 TaxID=2782343 RepID=UPI0024B7475E|nr:hypothetical protein [Streptomyces sp. HNM0645]MDI9884672.1 hypothetical protein [Streptomyces sp. HNM0645]